MKKILFLLCASIFFLGIFFIHNIYAALPGEGLTISPPIKEVAIKPGESITQKVKLTNPTKNLVEVYPKVMDFKAKGEGGEPDFYQASSEDTKFALSKWVTFKSAKIALTSQQVVEYEYTINVPQEAEPGGHYGVVFFSTEPPEFDENQGSQVALSSMIGSLVLVKVPGDIQEEGSLEGFDTNKFFYLNNDVNLTSRIGNFGNVHFKPEGSIEIKSLLGKNIETIAVNEMGGNVLPDSIRRFENNWKSGKFLCGIYKANLGLVYGDSAQKLTGNATFIVVPWWMLIIIAVILILFIALLIIIIRKLIKRRRRKKAQNTPPQNPESSGKIILR